MRIVELQLLKFGPFDGHVLRFPNFPEGAGLHLVYGRNEAGKSTALRAIKALLFGIPSSSPDDFLFPGDALRIGARLRHSDGTEAEFLRRKGSQALLGSGGQAAPAETLEKFRLGVDGDAFSTLFGIDHQGLLSGGELLLKSRGEAGMSLLSAGLGGSHLRELAQALEEDAERLYKKRAKKPALNDTLIQYEEARTQIGLLGVAARVYTELRQQLEDAERARDESAGALRELAAQRMRKERLRDALPHLAKRSELLAKLRAMGSVVVLPSEFSAQRQAAAERLAQLKSRERLLAEKISQLESRSAELQVQQALLEQEPDLTDVHQRLSAYTTGLKDLPAREAECRAAEEQAAAILRDLLSPSNSPQRAQRTQRTAEMGSSTGLSAGGNEATPNPSSAFSASSAVNPAEAERLRPSTRQRAQIEALIASHPELSANCAHLRKICAELEREAQLLHEREQLEGQEPTRDCAGLERIVQRAQKKGDLEAACAAAARELDERVWQAQADLKRLRLWSGTLEELAALPVPPLEAVERFAESFGDCKRELKAAGDAQRQSAEKAGLLQQEIDRLLSGGEITSEEQLKEAREQREAAWQRVRACVAQSSGLRHKLEACAANAALQEAIERYENSVRRADEISDALRREASRIAEFVEKSDRRRRLREEAAEIAARRARTEERQAELQRRWLALWQPLGIAPDEPAAMRAWLQCQNDLVKKADGIGKSRIAVEQLRKEIGDLCAELRHEMEFPPQSAQRTQRTQKTDVSDENKSHPSSANSASSAVNTASSAVNNLDDLLAGALEAVEKLKTAARKRAQLQESIHLKEGQLRSRQQEYEAELKKLRDWQAAWAAAVEHIGLAGDATPAQAVAVLNRIGELFNKLAERDTAAARTARIRELSERFREDVAELVRRLAPEMAQLPAEQSATALYTRLSRAREDQALRMGLLKQREEAAAELEQTRESIGELEIKLREFCKQARCGDVSELDEIERRSAEHGRLSEEIGRKEEMLLQSGGGQTVEQLAQAAEQADRDALPGQIADLQRRIAEGERELSQLDQWIGESKVNLRQVDGGSRAAEAAENAQLLLGRIRADSEQYLRLRMAAALLRRELERYRRENQDSLLGRAGKVFHQLTLGAFAGLETEAGAEGRTLLVGVRTSGGRVRVEGMSEGTRDQLYFALRLAHLRECLQAKGFEPLPFIADDVLINFDDERGAAALEALEGLSRLTQVIVFTHHAHVLALAKRTLPRAETVGPASVPAGALRVCSFGPPPREPAPRESRPLPQNLFALLNPDEN